MEGGSAFPTCTVRARGLSRGVDGDTWMDVPKQGTSAVLGEGVHGPVASCPHIQSNRSCSPIQSSVVKHPFLLPVRLHTIGYQPQLHRLSLESLVSEKCTKSHS